ncbi:hypothetical protein [Brevibacillus fortis]|uniref:Uncharacterized protein n=1 Tax=Brevibacillus fortis TaxID=2126352 RepID=A0A2P7UIN5_9BACL|nr:hypothetical protein [Brevibacillus fortis]PSJ86797.1 hypothetical protein C7R93_27895 [Brevibacillus fortis]
MRSRIFYAAKVNIHGNILSPNLRELIEVHIPRVILNPNRSVRLKSWNWSFTDTKQIPYQDKQLIIGNVTKSRHMKQKYKIGSVTQEQQTEHELAKTAFFVYDPVLEILAHESNAEISAADFRYLFTTLLSSDMYVGEVRVLPIPIPHKIRDEIRSIQIVTSLKFNLIHPNPGKEEFNIYNDLIDDANLKELDISMTNKDGIKVIGHSTGTTTEFTRTVENGITLVEKGYGEIRVSGFDKFTRPGKRGKMITDTKPRKFSSSNEVRRIRVSELTLNGVLSKLYTFIGEVKNKVKGGQD